MINAPVADLTEEGRTMRTMDDNGNVTELVCKEIYYLPEDKVNQFMKEYKWDGENTD